MKKTFSLLLIMLSAMLIIPLGSCKKGPNDPAISFRSRDARITAKWKLVEVEGTRQGGGIETTYTYDGTNYSQSNSVSTFTGTASFEMTIDKSGVCNYAETITPDGSTHTGTTNWSWMDNDKNKSAIYIENIDVGSEMLNCSCLYNINELKTGELILKCYSYIFYSGGIIAYDMNYTFERQ